MNAGSIVAIAVVLLLLAVGVFVVTARRHDSRRGQGGLSRETRQRDRSGRDDEEAEEPPAPTGRELEPVAVAASPVPSRRSRRRLWFPTSLPTPRPSVSPGASSSTAASSG